MDAAIRSRTGPHRGVANSCGPARDLRPRSALSFVLLGGRTRPSRSLFSMYITTAKVNQWLHSLHTSHKREKMCYLPRGFGQVIIQNKFQMNIVECSSRSALRAAASSQCCQLHVSRMSSLEAPQLVDRRRRVIFRWKRFVAGSRAQTPLRFG